mmetsp:Transcript_56151/g.149865  ORF Transcript_56151/g.149865 Transcript_56151/m.149865 type:complete len:202 (+) Transcript_56151:277-882(+)
MSFPLMAFRVHPERPRSPQQRIVWKFSSNLLPLLDTSVAFFSFRRGVALWSIVTSTPNLIPDLDEKSAIARTLSRSRRVMDVVLKRRIHNRVLRGNNPVCLVTGMQVDTVAIEENQKCVPEHFHMEVKYQWQPEQRAGPHQIVPRLVGDHCKWRRIIIAVVMPMKIPPCIEVVSTPVVEKFDEIGDEHDHGELRQYWGRLA